jgi:16S rRNA (cytosine967-C5)-methyltransferase
MRHALVQNLVLEGLERTLDQKQPADRVLDKILRNNRQLSSCERALVARGVLGVVCLYARLDHLLLPVSCAMTDPHRFRWASYLVSEEQFSLDEAAQISGVDAENLQPLLAAPSWPTDLAERLAAQRSLPLWLAQRWVHQFGFSEADALAQSMNKPGPLTVRINLLLCSRSEARNNLAKEGIESRETSYSPMGLHLLGRPNVFGSDAWRSGFFEVQDEGSQLISLLTAAQPGEKCVDFCAGSGGKTLALAAQMEDRGEIWALDTNASRLANLKPRLARAGVSCVRSILLPLDGPLPDAVLHADRVLVDAPCSSLGTLRRSPDGRWNLKPEHFSNYATIAQSILSRASQCLRPGGLLVYATCSIDLVENEQVASQFETQNPSFKRVNIKEFLGTDLTASLYPQTKESGFEPKAMQLYPHIHHTDGFFACAWRATSNC